MIDTHCHIDFEEYDKDRKDVIDRAQNVLDSIVDSGINKATGLKILELAKKYPDFIYPSLGFSPVSSHEKTREEIKEFREFLIDNINNCVAIGEVGMDYYFVRDKASRQKQRENFISFVEIADEYKKPLLLHVRDCDKKGLNIVNEYDNIPYVVFHCFSGSLKTAKRIMEHDNYFMSFSTMVCYSKHHQDLAAKIPVEYMLTETDSPFLGLTKEERNEPAYVLRGAKKIAEIQNIDLEEVDKITTNNAKKVFNI